MSDAPPGCGSGGSNGQVVWLLTLADADAVGKDDPWVWYISVKLRQWPRRISSKAVSRHEG